MHYHKVALAALVSTAVAQQTPSLVQALNSTADLSRLNQLIGSNPTLASQLASLSNITVLAPNNAAIDAFARANNATLGNADLLAATLTYHILNGTYASFGNTSTFVRTALLPGRYANVTGGQRVQARTINGTATFFSGYKYNSTAVGAAVNITGGVVHIINSVLTVPGKISSTAAELGLASAAGALVNASLVQTVDNTPNLTLFAPNNAAFQRIGSALPNLTTQQLSQILRYHAVPQVAYSTSLTNGTVTSLEGAALNITVYNASTVYVNNARVVIANVLVANGVVHVIDEVLNPSNTTAPTGQPNFPGASSVSSTPFATQAPTPTRTNVPSATTTSSHGAGWMVKPTGLMAAVVAGAVLVL